MLQQEGDYLVGQNAHGGGRYTRAPAQQQQQNAGMGGFPFWLPNMGLGNFYTPYGAGDAQNVPNATLGANFLGQQPNLQSLYGQPMGQVPGQKQQIPTSGVGNPLIAGSPPAPSPNGWANMPMLQNPNNRWPLWSAAGGNQTPAMSLAPQAGQTQQGTQQGTQQFPAWANMPYLQNPAMRPRPFMGS